MTKRAMSGWSTRKWNHGGLGGGGYAAHGMSVPMRRGVHGFGLGAYSPATPCNQIPPGDPYRVPGNQCAGVNGSLSYDSSGNLVSAGSTGVPPTAADQYSPSIIPGISNTTLAIGALAIGAFLLLRK